MTARGEGCKTRINFRAAFSRDDDDDDGLYKRITFVVSGTVTKLQPIFTNQALAAFTLFT
jgi:hypothetical protein